MSSSSSASDSEHLSSSTSTRKRKQVLANHELEHDSNSDESDSDSFHESASQEEAPVLSHAERRRQKKKEDNAASKCAELAAKRESSKKAKDKVQITGDLPLKVPSRQNSVWVGNLSFKTTPLSLRNFFEGVGEITRIHMPTKMAHGGPDGKPRKENRGFAYVDFATPDAKAVAVTMSEKPLEGRRLLIKDGDDFAGRPAAATIADGAPGAAKITGLTKTAQKILSAQKQPPGPTLFVGNLGFDATEESIRELLLSHRASDPPEGDKWVRKIRLGTFEDSGKCKGWAFVDFTSNEHATAALTNPKNHHLNGRKLVVEYASPDAVRRGGGGPPREPREKKPKELGPGVKRERLARKEHDGAEQQAMGQEAERPMKKQRVEGGNESRPRTKERRVTRSKPGAALAMAKREDPAIVPSQGKKIVF